ncbi:hypothetical protein FXN63_18370 [Pigmentiphaga aceris]|uniref:Uncharacterized protein n=1 Tax=Pigmentiphaga aceris TaxID=1940612 RepID=A0A5C0B1E1_9BURK|nr:hypothetical protein [Pigmentiphaga aceris]QEI07583.1 hypothetical protein FXN63_18370 [Pigmentiphaga aceris]
MKRATWAPAAGFPSGASAVRGQALVLVLFLLVLGSAVLIHLFNAGQLIGAKTRLVHVVDAAAYSGAVIQARALNFHAYVNRAQLAHQVAMAHLVTMASWARFGDTEALQLAQSNPPLGVITSFFGVAHGTAYAQSAGAVGQRPALARAFDAHDQTVHQVLMTAQRAVFNTLAQSRLDAIEAVVAANYDGTPPLADVLADTLPGTLRWQSGSARESLRAVAAQAVAPYDYLGPRNYIARSLLPVSARCPWLRHELRRNGATQQLGLEGWEATDTQSWHALRSNQWIGCYFREYPMGRALAQTTGNPLDVVEEIEGMVEDAVPTDFSQEDFWRWATRQSNWNIFGGSSNPLGQAWAFTEPVRLGGRGLPANAGLSSGRDSVRFVLRLREPQARLPTTDGSSRVKAGVDKLHIGTHTAGGDMAAMAAAETYYVRPAPRPDGRGERANLFQPYWQARLVPVRQEERVLARSLQGFK